MVYKHSVVQVLLEIKLWNLLHMCLLHMGLYMLSCEIAAICIDLNYATVVKLTLKLYAGLRHNSRLKHSLHKGIWR